MTALIVARIAIYFSSSTVFSSITVGMRVMISSTYARHVSAAKAVALRGASGASLPPPAPARIPQKRIKRRVPKFCSSSSAEDEDEESNLPTPWRSASTPQTDGTLRGETSWTPKITPSFERRKPRYLITACIIIGTLSPDTTDAEAAACPSLILRISSTPAAEGRHVTALTPAR